MAALENVVVSMSGRLHVAGLLRQQPLELTPPKTGDSAEVDEIVALELRARRDHDRTRAALQNGRLWIAPVNDEPDAAQSPHECL
jgi:hypothetical protein